MDEKAEQKLERTNCEDPDIADELLSYLNEDLSGKNELRIKTHLLGCTSCQEELKLLRAVRKVQQEDFATAALAFLKRRA